MLSRSILILFVLFFETVSFAKTIPKVLSSGTTDKPLLNETVEYTPIADHHFNLEAPQNCGKSGTLDPSARKIRCQFHKAGEHEVTVSVCDNDKAYCKQEYHKVVVQNQSSGTPRMKALPSGETLKMQSEYKKKVMQAFQVISPEEAQKKVAGKKAILAMSSTDWCPPCNMAKEFLLSHPKFADLGKDVLMVYVDGDSPASDPWKPVLDSFYYPSFVLLNPNLEVIGLKTGYVSYHDLKIWMEQSLADGLPLQKLFGRTQERLRGDLWSRVKDFFSGGSSEAQTAVVIDWLLQRSKTDEALALAKKMAAPAAKWKLQQAQYWQMLRNAKPSDADKQAKLDMEAKILETMDDNPEFSSYSVTSFCRNTKGKRFSSKQCDAYVEQAISKITGDTSKKWLHESEGEKALSAAGLAGEVLSLRQAQGTELSKLKKYAMACQLAHDNLMKYSPLKEKSRVARMGKLQCTLEGDDGAGTEKTLLSLRADFPFEETFHRKLAALKEAQKKWPQALGHIDEALKYSYGTQWLINVLNRVEVLKGMGKSRQAYAFLGESMKDIQVSDEGRDARWFKKMRVMYEELRKTEEKI